MGFYDEPGGHGEVSFTDVRLPLDAIIAGPGRGFEIAQGRLGPGRVHHCMRLVGLAEAALELAIRRGTERLAFGKPLIKWAATANASPTPALPSTSCACSCCTPRGCSTPRASPVPGRRCRRSRSPRPRRGAGDRLRDPDPRRWWPSDDFPLAGAWTAARALRLADGPDEVHQGLVARFELGKYQ